MERALESALANKVFVKGLLCADSNGLLISAKGVSLWRCHAAKMTFPISRPYSLFFPHPPGELKGAPAGRYCAISRAASSLCPEQAAPTTIIETQTRNVVVRDYDAMTVVMRCSKE